MWPAFQEVLIIVLDHCEARFAFAHFRLHTNAILAAITAHRLTFALLVIARNEAGIANADIRLDTAAINAAILTDRFTELQDLITLIALIADAVIGRFTDAMRTVFRAEGFAGIEEEFIATLIALPAGAGFGGRAVAVHTRFTAEGLANRVIDNVLIAGRAEADTRKYASAKCAVLADRLTFPAKITSKRRVNRIYYSFDSLPCCLIGSVSDGAVFNHR